MAKTEWQSIKHCRDNNWTTDLIDNQLLFHPEYESQKIDSDIKAPLR